MRHTVDILPEVIDQCQAFEQLGLALAEVREELLTRIAKGSSADRAGLVNIAALAVLGLRLLEEDPTAGLSDVLDAGDTGGGREPR